MIVTCALVEREGKFLMCRRSAGSSYPGFWEFPGGKLEDGETVEECLERELFEELGIRARAGRILSVVSIPGKPSDFRLVVIQTKILGGDLAPAVHDAVEWFSLQKLPIRDILPADILFIWKYLQKFTK
ncbi:MAG: (deoxy)nucleoside triphosphate pyrophosphohydrolase [Fibrobacter sp.]|nr:(deoxy)nucleoside triphosphate pyrophosphohydrolase [Fibrobacter sp.]